MLLLLAAALLTSPLAAAQDTTGPAALRPPQALFRSHEPLVLTIEADYGAIFKERDDEARYQPAVLRIAGSNGATASFNIELRTRGHFRRQSRICAFPPIRVDFPKDSMVGTVFEDQNRIDLATHCQNREQYEQITLLEYLIYRSYTILTDKSFLVRLARISYVNTAGNRDTLTKYGFFVEDKPAMAKRIGGEVFDQQEVHDDNTDFEQMTLTAMFEYFIGNTDWSVWALHNILLVQIPPGPFPTAVPFDFDWSGLVNAPYARPDARLPIRAVRERLFRGYCRTPEELAPVIARFNEKKDEIYALFQNQEGLTEDTKKKSIQYFDEFYKIINDPRAVDREILRKCRQS